MHKLLSKNTVKNYSICEEFFSSFARTNSNFLNCNVICCRIFLNHFASNNIEPISKCYEDMYQNKEIKISLLHSNQIHLHKNFCCNWFLTFVSDHIKDADRILKL